MKKIKILYWIFTGLMLALMLFSGISGLVSSEQSKAIIAAHLGYPDYFVPLISIVKLLGVVAILVPGFPRLKEWAYAGFVFDLGMAIYSFIAVGDPVAGTLPIFVGLIFAFGSYMLYHRKMMMASANNASEAMATDREVSVG